MEITVLVDMRDAFFNGIYDVIEEDKNVVVLTADHGAFRLSEIERDFPEQFLNVGIAEQNMISVAAGLAQCGKIVYVYSINNFISMRSLEQVNIDLCGMNLHVNLVGVGAGFTYSTDGPTHQGMQDMQAMSTLPGLSVYNVTDDINSYKLAKIGYRQPGPKYFRIEKGKNERIYNLNHNISDGLYKISDSNETLILSTGYMTHTAINVSKKIDNIGVVDIYRTKPLNEKKIVDICRGVKNIITLEEGTYSGGLCEKIALLLLKNNINCNFLPIAVEDKPCYYYGNRQMLHEKYKIDTDNICKKIKIFMESR